MKISPLAIALIIAVACFAGLGNAATAAGTGSHTISITLTAVGGSGETGTAVIAESAGNVQIRVVMNHPVAPVQPIHIHPGTCTNSNPNPAYSLGVLSNGRVTTVLKGVSLHSLLGKYVINVHKSTAEMGTYVSCGAIR
jgi:Cu/Zn superoxide dismutase